MPRSLKVAFVLCGLGGIVVGWLAWRRFGEDSGLRITISRETTWLEGPVTEDGFIDYVAALDARASQGVTPETNAAVPFARVAGSEVIGPEHREEFFRKLGIDPPPADGSSIVSLEAFGVRLHEERVALGLAEVGIPPGERTSHEESQFLGDLYAMRDKALERPWRADELPELKRWLDANEKPLAEVIEGSRRERWYMPLVPRGAGMLSQCDISYLGVAREAAYLLACRAMLHTGEGRGGEAASDLGACWRFARLLARGPALIMLLLGWAIESIAWRSGTALVHSGELGPEELRDLAAMLEQLPPRPSVADTIDRSERCNSLDAVALLAREGFDAIRRALDGSVEARVDSPPAGSFDPDAVLRRLNRTFDRLVEAMRIEDREERVRTLEEVDREVRDANVRARGTWAQIATALSRERRSQFIGEVLLGLIVPALVPVRLDEEESEVELDLLRVAIALERWRRENGSYPETLDALAGSYLDSIPPDVFSGRSPGYARDGAGYVLWSAGRDGEDETRPQVSESGGEEGARDRNGRGDIEAGEEAEERGTARFTRDSGRNDDIVIRAPPE